LDLLMFGKYGGGLKIGPHGSVDNASQDAILPHTVE